MHCDMKKIILILSGICAAIVVSIFVVRDHQCSGGTLSKKTLTPIKWILEKSHNSVQDSSHMKNDDVHKLHFAQRELNSPKKMN